ncbi:MAG: KH domain-containing protein [Candidatus Thermoplasmatota archaeon]
MKYVRIPKDRIGVLIGQNGETKEKIEEKSGVELDIDSKEGDVSIDTHQTEDPLMSLKAKNIVKAIGRGFSPRKALKLLSDDMDLFIFDLQDYVGKKKNHLRRVKGRVIGKKGKTKRILEELTGSDISIYGHTVSVISDIASMDITKKALDMLLSGSKHATVYNFVETEMKEFRIRQRSGF